MLAPGSIVGGYRVELLLGRGAMGEVYRAIQLTLDRPVAIKRIAAHLLDQPGAIARFEREARCLARVHCSHVVAVHDFGQFTDQAGDQHWLIIMELVEGMSLGKALQIRGRIPWPEATLMVLHIAEGLAAVADLGVVHRDLKPDNILISKRGIAKITDFGLARATDSTTMTVEGAMLGTPLYMPPEACLGHVVDHRGDLYSLGCTWFHILTGQPPFRAASSIALLRMHVEDTPPDIATLITDLPGDLYALLNELLAKDPAHRPTSAASVAERISASTAAGQMPRILDVTTLPMADQPTIIPLSTTPVTEALDTQQSPTAATRLASAVPTPVTQSSPDANAATVASSTFGHTSVPTGPSSHRWLLIGSFAVIIVLVIVLLFPFGSGHQRDVDAAIASGDTSLALQRAAAALAENPGDADITALVRKAVNADIQRLCANVRHDDAKQRLTEYRQRWPWLDTGPLEDGITIDQAQKLAKDGRFGTAFDIFIPLYNKNPKNILVCQAIIAAFPDHRKDNLVLAAADVVVDAGGDPGEPVDQTAYSLLADSLQWDSSYGSSGELRRARIIAHCPDVPALALPLLQSDSYEARDNGRLLLEAVGAFTDPLAITFHWRMMCELSSSYSITESSTTWLHTACTSPDWKSRKAAAALPPLTTCEGLRARNDHANAVRSVLAQGFPQESLAAAPTWVTSDDADLRWNTYLLLSDMQALDTIDLPAFHYQTLKLFEPRFDQLDMRSALEWCITTSKTPRAATTRTALIAANQRAEAFYRIAKERDSDQDRDAIKVRIRAINDALDRVRVP